MNVELEIDVDYHVKWKEVKYDKVMHIRLIEIGSRYKKNLSKYLIMYL